MKREKIVIMPRLNNCQGNIKKKWFVFYSVRNPKSGKMERFKDYSGLAKKKQTASDRYAVAEQKINSLREKLLNGWSPFVEEEDAAVLYSDTIQYKNVASIIGNARKKNKTFNFFANEFMAHIASSIRKDTIDTYTSKLRIFEQWLAAKGMDGNDISAITNEVIQDFNSWLIDVRQLSGVSVSKYVQLLKNVFEFAIQKKATRINPVVNLRKCKRINDSAPRPIHEEDIELFIQEVRRQDPQLYLLICFEYYCFLRPGKEIRMMKVDWIDWSRGLVTVPKEWSKNKRPKMVTIPDQLMQILRQFDIHKAQRELYVFGNNGRPGPMHYGKNHFRIVFNQIRQGLDMPEDYKLYSWKHTGNIKALEAGISQMEIMDQNGHSSLEVTNNYIRNRVRRVSPQIQKAFPSISE